MPLLLEGLALTILALICGLLVGTLGASAPFALCALAGSLIGRKDTRKVFTGLAVAETLSTMAAYPTVAGLYKAGIGKGGGAWLWMLFDITGLILGVSTVVMCLLKFRCSSKVMIFTHIGLGNPPKTAFSTAKLRVQAGKACSQSKDFG
jgi:hypothetical protein